MAARPQTAARSGPPRDHGGGIDAVRASYGGTRADWLDLSTGVNPCPYPLGPWAADAWTALPDRAAQAGLERAARRFWNLPEGADIIAAPGASSLIARIPELLPPGTLRLDAPTYNEHAAAFARVGWRIIRSGPAEARVVVHPNNPDGRLWDGRGRGRRLTVIDESFCDVTPDRTLTGRSTEAGTLILKSFGKFWGLAGLRLGFAIGDPDLIAALTERLGPWPVSGPALAIGTRALEDDAWAGASRRRLRRDAAQLDRMVTARGLRVVGGTDLFRLYRCKDAAAVQEQLARARIWTRVFPYSTEWIRFGLPGSEIGWRRLQAALARLEPDR